MSLSGLKFDGCARPTPSHHASTRKSAHSYHSCRASRVSSLPSPVDSRLVPSPQSPDLRRLPSTTSELAPHYTNRSSPVWSQALFFSTRSFALRSVADNESPDETSRATELQAHIARALHVRQSVTVKREWRGRLLSVTASFVRVQLFMRGGNSHHYHFLLRRAPDARRSTRGAHHSHKQSAAPNDLYFHEKCARDTITCKRS